MTVIVDREGRALTSTEHIGLTRIERWQSSKALGQQLLAWHDDLMARLDETDDHITLNDDETQRLALLLTVVGSLMQLTFQRQPLEVVIEVTETSPLQAQQPETD